MSVKIRKPYQRIRVQFETKGPSLTKQSFKDECDVNYILKRYQKTGLLEHVSRFNGDYSDLTEAPDFHTAMNTVIQATEAFETLPSSLRKKFSNDPSQFLDFVSNPQNGDQLIELGLALPPSGSVSPPAIPTPKEPTAGDPATPKQGEKTQ